MFLNPEEYFTEHLFTRHSVNNLMGLEHCWNCNCNYLCNEGREFHTGIRVGSRWTCHGEPGWAKPSVMFFGNAPGNQCNPILPFFTRVQELGLSLRHLSVVWSGTGSLMLKRMEHHSSGRTREPIRATETGWITEAQSAKPWAWTHKKLNLLNITCQLPS